MYIPYKRGPYARLGPLLFLLVLGCIFAVTGYWWVSGAFALMALWILVYAPALEINPHKHLYRSTNNLRLFPSRWEKLPPARYLSVFGVGLQGFDTAPSAFTPEGGLYINRSEGSFTDTGLLQDPNDKEIYVFLVTDDKERFVLSHYSDRETALEHARMIATYMKLDLWNATARTPYWEKTDS